MTYSISKRIFWPIFRLFIKDIKGIENLPKKTCMIVSNHQSYIDAAIILLMFAWHRNTKIYIFATRQKFMNPIWQLIFWHFGAIRLGGAISKGLQKLKEGHSILIFPEGQRTFDGKIQTVNHFGLGVLALNAKVPILPIGLRTFDFWNRYNKLPNWKKNIRIIIGKQITTELTPTPTNYKKITNTAMNEVARLARISNS